MPLTPLLLILIGIILVVDIAIVAAPVHRDSRRRRSAVDGLVRSVQVRGGSAVAHLRARGSTRSLTGSLRRPGPAGRQKDARTAAAIEAFIADIDGGAGGGVRRRIPEAVNAFPREIGDQSTTADPPAPDRSRPVVAAWSVSRTGKLESAADPGEHAEFARSVTWEALLIDESARVRRFGRPATVVLAECPGLDSVADRLGVVAADRIVAEVDRVLRAESRTTDRVVRLGPARFGVLMVETSAADGRRYVERVRKAAGHWFESAGLSPNLAIGWASPDEGEDLSVAAANALGLARISAVGMSALSARSPQ
jgi:diguanylate cyclase (GGDEF)-like protein